MAVQQINKQYSYSKLQFVGHGGAIQTLKRQSGKIMFVPDANLVLNLLNNLSDINALPFEYKEFLRLSRNKAHLCWRVRGKWMPINPVLAVMELTKQEKTKNYDLYLNYFNNFFEKIYGINDFDPRWVFSTYNAAMKILIGLRPSIVKTIEKIYSIIPTADKPTDAEILTSCEDLFQWIWSEKENLSVIGGTILYVAVYAIAGSPDARKILKINSAIKNDKILIAKNVAWDFLYWITLDFEYHYKKYNNTIICTSDKSLADLISNRINIGSRFGLDENIKTPYIESKVNLKPFKFKRLIDTKLEKNIYEKLIESFARIQTPKLIR